MLFASPKCIIALSKHTLLYFMRALLPRGKVLFLAISVFGDKSRLVSRLFFGEKLAIIALSPTFGEAIFGEAISGSKTNRSKSV